MDEATKKVAEKRVAENRTCACTASIGTAATFSALFGG